MRKFMGFLAGVMTLAVLLATVGAAATTATKASDWAKFGTTGSVTITDGTNGQGASIKTAAGTSEAAFQTLISGAFTISANITFPEDVILDGTGGPEAYFGLRMPVDNAEVWLLFAIRNSNGDVICRLQIHQQTDDSWTENLLPEGSWGPAVTVGSQTINVTMAHDTGSDSLWLILTANDAEFARYEVTDSLATNANFYNTSAKLKWTVRNGEGSGIITFSDTRYEAAFDVPAAPPTTTAPTIAAPTGLTTASTSAAATAGTTKKADDSSTGMPTWGWIAIAAGAVVIIAGVVTFVVLKGKKKKVAP
ncbi:MAG: hypothetical protein FWF49_06625 [Oscillospiraceae bacterium]|nr:hypothetical protein [Oscillospiraceae bacterium]